MRKLPSNTKFDFGVRCAEDKKAYMAGYMKMYNTTKIECETCGISVVRSIITKHRKTKKHLRNLEKKQNE